MFKSPEAIAAWIAFGGVIISAVLSFWISKRTLKLERNKLYSDMVTKNRHDWLTIMRKHISAMLAEARYSISKKFKFGKNKAYYLHRNEVLIRLNLSEPYHLLLKQKIEELDTATTPADYKKAEKDIYLIAEPLLKFEWDKVRKEAKGGK